MSKKSPFGKKDLKTFKNLIEQKSKKRRKELKALKSSLKDQRKYMKSTNDNYDRDASTIRNKEMLESMARRTERKVEKYDNALKRIKKGTYGICRKTGKAIDRQRLLVMPEATTCIK